MNLLPIGPALPGQADQFGGGLLLGQKMAGWVPLVETLLNQDGRGDFFIGFSGGQGLVKSVNAVFKFLFAYRLVGVKGIIDDQDVAVKAGQGAANGGAESVPAD